MSRLGSDRIRWNIIREVKSNYKTLFSDLDDNLCSEPNKKMCKKTLSTYLKRLLKEEVFFKDGHYYKLTKRGEEEYLRYKIQEELKKRSKYDLTVFWKDLSANAYIYNRIEHFKEIIQLKPKIDIVIEKGFYGHVF